MKKKKFLVLFAILLLVVGYAAVTSTLNITGLTKVGSNQEEFDVYFSNAKEGNKEGTVENKKVIKDDTHIAFNKDMKSVGETYVLEYDVTNGSRTYDASISITCTESTEYLKITNEFDTTTDLLATETRSGKLTVEVIKSYVGTEANKTLATEIGCTITGNAQERTSKGTGTPAIKLEHWKLTDDADNDGELSIGDLITLGTESFYVYDVDGDNVKALAQYDLLVEGGYGVKAGTATGMQDAEVNYSTSPSKRYGTVAFDKNGNTDYATSEIKQYVDAYATKLNALNGQLTSAGLITVEELEALGCSAADYACLEEPAFVYSRSYWTSSATTDSGGDAVWGIQGYGNLRHGTVDLTFSNFGVRPVITISKSLF